MKKIILTVIAIFIIIICSVFFGKKVKDENKIIISEVTHSIFYTPFYVAIENGYFNEENLNVELMLTPGADKVATSILSDDANIGLSGPEATIYVYNNSGQKLITFASLTKRDGQFIVGDCSLKNNFKMTDLIGKKVLAGRIAGMPLLMFEYALKESNIDKSLVNIDTSVDFASLSGAYIGGSADFVNLFEPNASNLEKGNYGCVLASLGSISGIIPYTTFYAKENYINDNKDKIKRFNKAINKGLAFTKENDAKKIALSIANQFPDTSIEDLILQIERYKNADSWYNSTFVNIDDFNRLQDILLYGNNIKNKINSNVLITNEFNN